MSKFLSLATGIFCLGLLALPAFVFDPSCLPHYALPERNPLQPTWAEIFARKEQLQRLEEDLHHLGKAKQQVTKEVISGLRSLAEAIEEFRRLDQPWTCASIQEQTLLQLKISEGEWRGRNVISFACRVLADRPDEAAAVADRLEKELQEFLAERGKQYPRPADPRLEPTPRDLPGSTLAGAPSSRSNGVAKAPHWSKTWDEHGDTLGSTDTVLAELAQWADHECGR